MSENILEKLKTDGEELVRALRKKNAEQGLRNLLTELYPDNAHFIYELLQNAEDTNATTVKFILEKDKLIFIHNGSRLFVEDDIVAITNIGVGTKKDDVNTIGKFGVGFKAVFAYTELPKVYSGKYNFEIKSLYVPQEIIPIKKDDSETVFVFPFNNKNKPRDRAYKEVNDSLSNLNRTTLLFLNSISEIEIKISDVSYTISKQTDRTSKLTKITNTKLNKETKFLVFNKQLPKEDKLYVSIAFRLTKIGKIAIENEAKVSIFFPAEKETSNLKFHIHAPFASTVARDSITNRDENNELIELIADLLCEATEWIKDKGFLDDNFIGCLPIDDDNISDFYKPIQSKIIDLFDTEPFLLCEDNEYHPARDCWQSTKRLKAVISTADLKTLLKGKINNDCFWTTKPFQRNASGRVYNFLKSLELSTYSEDDFEKNIVSLADNYVELPYKIKKEIEKWKEDYGWENNELSTEIGHTLNLELTNKDIVIRLFSFIENDSHSYYSYRVRGIKDIIRANYSHIVITEFLLGKSDEWLKEFYELLYDILFKDYYDEDDYFDKYKNLRLFIKLQNGEFNFSKSECYFPSKASINSIKKFIISIAIYNDNFNKKKFSKSKRFLKSILGVKEIAIDDEVNHILKKYKDGVELEHVQNVEHLKLFLKYYKENKPDFKKKYFENTSFLINSDNELTKPSFILIDEPLESTSLSRLSDINYKPLHPVYFEPENDILIKEFKEFLISVGCNITLPIKKRINDLRIKAELGLNERETEYGKNENYYLPILCPFNEPKIKTSLIVWNGISKLRNGICFDAIYKANGSSETRNCNSDIIETLKANAWIPSINGEFYKPEGITEDNLHKDFEFNNQNGWLTRIGFGQNAIKSQKLEDVKDEIKQHTGYSLDTLEEAHKAGITEQEISKLINDKKRKSLELEDGIKNHNRNIDTNNSSLSPSIVSDTIEYREKAQQQLYKNVARSEKKRHSYNYSKKVKIGKPETLEFLKKQYQGHCQICGFTFSQSGSKGNYFEMFDWLSEKISKQESNIIEAGTSLSLCSRCHSILKHGDFEANFLDSIQNIENTDYSEFAKRFDLTLDREEIPEDFDFIEMDMYKLPIRKLNTDEHIFFSEEHFIHFHNALTLNEKIEDEDYEEQQDKQENSNVVEQELPEIESKRVAELWNIVTVNYSNLRKTIKVKLVQSARVAKDSKGNKLISTSSDFGKLIKGKPKGYIFEMGKNMVEIIDIE